MPRAVARVARALRLEQRRGKFGDGDEDAFRRMVGAGIGVEHDVGRGLVRLGAAHGRAKMPLVGRELRRAHSVFDVELLIALRHRHARQDGSGAVGTEDEVDLVRRDEALIEGARHVGLRLVVEQDVLYRPAQQPAFRVDLIDEDLADHLMNESGLGERPGERQGLADLDRLRALGAGKSSDAKAHQSRRARQQVASRCAICLNRHQILPRMRRCAPPLSDNSRLHSRHSCKSGFWVKPRALRTLATRHHSFVLGLGALHARHNPVTRRIPCLAGNLTQKRVRTGLRR